MSAHEFFTLFHGGFIPFHRFTELIKSDRAEGKIPKTVVNETWNKRFLKRQIKPTYVSCWCKSECENSLLWRAYAQKGFAIETTKRKLSSVLDLASFSEQNDYRSGFKAYDVDYLDEKDFSFRGSESKIGEILSWKRKAFSTEDELRFLYLDVSPNASWKHYTDRKKWLLVRINNFTWVDNVLYDPKLAEWSIELAQSLLKSKGVSSMRPGIE